MLSFVQGWLAPRCNPIGIDFGSDALRLCQVQWTGEEYKLLAAATADVPTTVRNDPAARFNFFVETTRDLLAQGNFRGRQVVLALPASTMFVRHLRMPKLDDEQMKKALPWELRGKLPIDPSHAVLRHVIAGEIYQDQEQKLEVIVVAAGRELVNQMLAAATRAKLDVVGMHLVARGGGTRRRDDVRADDSGRGRSVQPGGGGRDEDQPRGGQDHAGAGVRESTGDRGAEGKARGESGCAGGRRAARGGRDAGG